MSSDLHICKIEDELSIEKFIRIVEKIGNGTVISIVSGIGSEEFIKIASNLEIEDFSKIVKFIGSDNFIKIVTSVQAEGFIKIINTVGLDEFIDLVLNLKSDNFIKINKVIFNCIGWNCILVKSKGNYISILDLSDVFMEYDLKTKEIIQKYIMICISKIHYVKSEPYKDEKGNIELLKFKVFKLQ